MGNLYKKRLIYPIVSDAMWILASRHQACRCSRLPQKLDTAEDEIHMASPKGKNFKKKKLNVELKNNGIGLIR